jgi:hypothetical protein
MDKQATKGENGRLDTIDAVTANSRVSGNF